MAAPKDKSLRSDIAEILKGADLTTLSSKKIRKNLEEKYGIDLTERKTAIDKMIMEMLTLEQNRQSSAASQSNVSSNLVSSSSKGKSRKRAENGDEDSDGSNSNESNNDDVRGDSPVRKKPKIEKEAKRSSSDEDSDEKDKDSELDDEDIARQLQEEEHKAARKTRGSAKPAAEKKKASRSKKEPGSSSRKTNKYTEPCYLSPQLAAIMGESRLKRSDVVKKMWAIVKERNLYDPRDKRFMICDAEMLSVFGCKKVQIFGMMKYLKHHITSPDDVA